MKPPTKCGRVHFEHRHRKWLVITVRPTTSVRKSPRKNLPSRNTPDSFCRLLHPTKSIAALRGRYFSFMVTCRGGGPSILLTQDRSVAQKPHWGFHCCATAAFCFPKNTKNPNPSPIEKRFGFSLFGAMEGTRTPGLLIRSARRAIPSIFGSYVLTSFLRDISQVLSFEFLHPLHVLKPCKNRAETVHLLPDKLKTTSSDNDLTALVRVTTHQKSSLGGYYYDKIAYLPLQHGH